MRVGCKLRALGLKGEACIGHCVCLRGAVFTLVYGTAWGKSGLGACW